MKKVFVWLWELNITYCMIKQTAAFLNNPWHLLFKVYLLLGMYNPPSWEALEANETCLFNDRFECAQQ